MSVASSLDGNRLEATPRRHPSHTAMLEDSGARD